MAKTPYELWVGKKPNIKHLHVWSCLVEARPYKPNEKKLDSRTVSCYFVGYSERSRGFNFYDPTTMLFFEIGNARFLEKIEFEGKIRFETLSLKRNLFFFLQLLFTMMKN